jgi:hypothetical protein
MNALVIFAKFPEAGKVKKKIGESIGMDVSAKLCEAFVQDLITEHKDRDYDLYLSFIGHQHKETYKLMFPEAIMYVQRGKNLGENLYFTFEDLLDDYAKVAIIGCDVPNLKHETVLKAFNALESYDAVFGPASDGGYYLIGMTAPNNVFEGLPWGKDALLEAQLNTLRMKKLTFVLLDEMIDVDTVDELRTLKKTLKAGDAPRTFEFIESLDV